MAVNPPPQAHACLPDDPACHAAVNRLHEKLLLRTRWHVTVIHSMTTYFREFQVGVMAGREREGGVMAGREREVGMMAGREREVGMMAGRGDGREGKGVRGDGRERKGGRGLRSNQAEEGGGGEADLRPRS